MMCFATVACVVCVEQAVGTPHAEVQAHKRQGMHPRGRRGQLYKTMGASNSWDVQCVLAAPTPAVPETVTQKYTLCLLLSRSRKLFTKGW